MTSAPLDHLLPKEAGPDVTVEQIPDVTAWLEPLGEQDPEVLAQIAQRLSNLPTAADEVTER